MLNRLIILISLVLLSSCAKHNDNNQNIFTQKNTKASKNNDDFLWLENLKSQQSLDWVAKQNMKTEKRLAPRQKTKEQNKNASMSEVLSKKVDKIRYLGKQLVRVKKYAAHSNGILETMTQEESKKTNPTWRKLIDFDVLSQKTGQSLTYGYTNICNFNNPSQCLVSLSADGSDTEELREFDIETGQFVTNGFVIPAGITYVSWVNKDTLLFSSTFGNNPVSSSNYGLSVKQWKRGEKIEEAQNILEKKTGDGLIPYQYYSKGQLYLTIQHWQDFYNGTTYYYQPEQNKLTQLNIPISHEVYGMNSGMLVIKNYKDWSVDGADYKKGSLIGVSLGAQHSKLETIFTPNKHQAFEEAYFTKQKILIMLLEDMVTKAVTFEKRNDVWVKNTIRPPSNASLNIRGTSYLNDEAIALYMGFLTPTSLYLINTTQGSYRLWDKEPDFFDTSGYQYEVAYATGEDGVKIPYQITRPKQLDPNTRYPVIIYVYGAYGVIRTAWYRGDIGTEWLSKGGIYVVANARGGGEYGEAWHQAALRTTKYKTADDVATVAKALINRNISIPGMIGVYGASSGGTTACSALTRYPELFNAAVCRSGFTDMLRFNQHFKGSSWVTEYGDPEIPTERAYLLKHSPYHLIESKKDFPAPFFMSYLNDDRVHPSHYRRMAAKMNKLGMDYYFYESPKGGHYGAVTKKERAKIKAMEYEYFRQRLFKPSDVQLR